MILALFFYLVSLGKMVDTPTGPDHSFAGKNYGEFVHELKEDLNDPMFLAALRNGDGTRDKVDFDFDAIYPVSQLIPLQNEIDVDKSLKYPLQKEDPQKLASFLNANSADAFVLGSPIITACGKYIVDGHHRWSQLYLINPNANMRAINMKVCQPFDALKFTQMAIVSAIKKLPMAVVTGKNMIDMSKSDFEAWIRNHITQSAIQVFEAINVQGIDEIIDWIWSHAQQMRQNNAPLPGAASRALMPQTDNAEGWTGLLIEGRVAIY